MKIKTFRAKDHATAMQKIRDTLGDDAAIIGCYEVGAEVEFLVLDDSAACQPVDTVVSNPRPTASEVMTSARDPNQLRVLQQEMGSMRALLERHLRRLGSAEAQATDPLRALVARLVTAGLDETVALELVGRLPPEMIPGQGDVLMKQLLALELPVRAEMPTRCALIGLPGSGKTTAIAKMAAQAVLQGQREHVGLISLDNQRLGGSDMLRSVARILKVPVLVAQDADDLARALLAFRDKTHLYIDTPAWHPHEVANQLRLQRLLGPLQDMEVCVAQAADHDWRMNRRLVQSWTCGDLSSTVVTRTDLASDGGALFNLALTERLPVMGAGAQASLTEPLNAVHAAMLADQLMGLPATAPDSAWVRAA